MAWKQPNRSETDQASLVQAEVIEMMNRLREEGITPNIIASGAGAAICDLLTTAYGNRMVPVWFSEQAKHTAALTYGGSQH